MNTLLPQSLPVPGDKEYLFFIHLIHSQELQYQFPYNSVSTVDLESCFGAHNRADKYS